MERRRLGGTSMEVSVLGFGGAELGDEAAPARTAQRLLDEALDAGLNVIDTAECYGDSESLIGGVAPRRGSFYLFTKCGHAAGLPGAAWEPETLRASIERSLRRLRTDYVDLLQLHSCPLAVLERGDAIAVLDQARREGKTRFVGYSGDGPEALWAVRSGHFDTLQTSVSIADQEVIERTLPEAAARGMGVIAKRPIANAAWRTGQRPEKPYHHTYWERLRRLTYDFLDGSTQDAVGTALRFTLATPGVHTAIVGTARPGRWQENARLLAQGPLPADAYRAIRARWREVAEADWTGQR